MSRRCANWLILCLALALSGCATVQIDVDAYKGPLANHKDVLYKNTLFMADTAQILLMNHMGRIVGNNDGVVSPDEFAKIATYCGPVVKVAYNKPQSLQFRKVTDIDRVCTLALLISEPGKSWGLKDSRPLHNTLSLSAQCEPKENLDKSKVVRIYSEVANSKQICDFEKLVNFSQKLITLGNATALELSDQPKKFVSTEMFGSPIVLQNTIINEHEQVDERVRYSALLQHLGNSIQVALHDYKQLSDHESRGSGKLAGVESSALRATLEKRSDEIYAEYLNILRSNRERLKTQSDEFTKLEEQKKSAESEKISRGDKLEEANLVLKNRLKGDGKLAVPTQQALKDWPAIWVYDAYTVLSDGKLTSRYLGDLSPSSIQKKEGQKTIARETIEKLGAGEKSKSELVAAIKAVLTARGNSLKSLPHKGAIRRSEALARAADYVGAIEDDIAKGDAAAVYQGIMAVLQDNLSSMQKAVRPMEDVVTQAEKSLKEKQSEIRALDAKLSDAGKATTLPGGGKLADEVADLTLTIETLSLDSNTDDILKSARKQNGDKSSKAPASLGSGGMLVLIQNKLDAHYKGEPAKKDKAIRVVQTYLSGVSLRNGPYCCSEGKSQVEVMDEAIAALRHELIRARRIGDDVQVKQIEAALREAYEQRSGMIYLRPAITYLRSTSTAAILQEEDGMTARNLLFQELKKGLPGWGGDAKKNAMASAREELDKQNWSNINSVKVSGGGNVNYALVKDDIGNWYVKGYAADASEVIRSAQSLGMFAMGGKLNTNILSALEQERDLKKELVDASGTDKAEIRKQLAANRTVIQDSGAINGIFDKFSGLYGTKTQAIAGDSAAAMKEDVLKGNIVSGWSSAVGDEQPFKDDLKSALDAAYTAVKSDVETQAADLGKKGITSAGIVDAAKMLRAFSAKLRATLGGADSNIGKKLAEKVSARKKASDDYDAALKAHKEALTTTDAGVIKTSGDDFINRQQALAAANGDLNQYQAKVNVVLEAADRKVYGLIRSMVSKQFDAASEFETAIIYLGEAASSKGKQ